MQSYATTTKGMDYKNPQHLDATNGRQNYSRRPTKSGVISSRVSRKYRSTTNQVVVDSSSRSAPKHFF